MPIVHDKGIVFNIVYSHFISKALKRVLIPLVFKDVFIYKYLRRRYRFGVDVLGKAACDVVRDKYEAILSLNAQEKPTRTIGFHT